MNKSLSRTKEHTDRPFMRWWDEELLPPPLIDEEEDWLS
jgi:hypothetical protein